MGKIIIANFKMNLSLEDIKKYIEIVSTADPDRFVVCPSNIYIPYFLNENYKVGLQNISYASKGAYTGEVSAVQASSMKIDYTIIGHSERRQYFNESIEEISKKIEQATSNNLKVIFCIGETLDQRDSNKTEEILKKQLESLMQKKSKDIIIAYEPVWAIGTSLTPSNEDIVNATLFIKKECQNYGFDNVEVLYGGSVNLDNIETLNSIKEISGFLIGGASLDPEKMLKILKVTR